MTQIIYDSIKLLISLNKEMIEIRNGKSFEFYFNYKLVQLQGLFY